MKAATDMWPTSRYVGVDIDSSSILHKIENAEFYNCDGRKYAVKNYKKKNYFDLILSNPPFGNIDESERILHYSKYSNIFKGLLNHRYENEMMAANVLLVKPNSVLVAILPSTFVEGSSNIKGRINLVSKLKLIKVIKLPRNTFSGCQINSYVLIMEKTDRVVSRTIYYEAHYSEKWEIYEKTAIDYDKIEKGDWTLHNSHITNRMPVSLFRGNISSSDFTLDGTLILHCSSSISSNQWEPSFRYIQNCNWEKSRYANRNDIIINRIGKGAGYWCINKQNRVIVSDCILVLSNPTVTVVDILIKNSNFGRLKIPLRGLATQYVTANDILGLFINNGIDNDL